MKTHFDTEVLIKSEKMVFVQLDPNVAKITVYKLNELHDFSNVEGILLYNVTMSINEHGVIAIEGSRCEEFIPKKRTLFTCNPIVTKEELSTISNLKKSDIVFRWRNKYILKRKYYKCNHIIGFNRCYYNMPLEIINCKVRVKQEEENLEQLNG